MTTRRVAWRRSDEIATDEHCTLTVRDGGLSLVGTVLGAEAGSPVRIEYRVLADGGRPDDRRPRARPARLRAADDRARARPEGQLDVDGGKARALKGCTDVDLGCSPSTNTLPIRRLALGIGKSKTIQAAWVRFPELTVVKAAQTYTRLDEFTYQYASGDFAAELSVDDDGLVGSYADWQRTGFAMGPDDTEPLDAGH